MSDPFQIQSGAAGLQLDEVDQLVALHRDYGLALTTPTGNVVVADGNAGLAVTELLRLAHLGAYLQLATMNSPFAKAEGVRREALDRWLTRLR